MTIRRSANGLFQKNRIQLLHLSFADAAPREFTGGKDDGPGGRNPVWTGVRAATWRTLGRSKRRLRPTGADHPAQTPAKRGRFQPVLAPGVRRKAARCREAMGPEAALVAGTTQVWPTFRIAGTLCCDPANAP